MASTAVADANAGGFGVGAAGVGQVLDGSNPAIVRLRQLVDGPQASGATGTLTRHAWTIGNYRLINNGVCLQMGGASAGSRA